MAVFLVTAKQSKPVKKGKLEKGMNVEIITDHWTHIFSSRCGELLRNALKNKYNIELESSDCSSTFFEIKQL